MQKLAPVAVTALVLLLGAVVVFGAAGCSSSVWSPQIPTSDLSAAAVTGFASSGPLAGSNSFGPVTVQIAGARASQLAQLVDQLPSVPQSQMDCIDGLGLVYRIVFSSGPDSSRTVVEGYRCNAGVTVTLSGRNSSWLRDADCTLIRAVRQMLPSRATATRSTTVGCQPPAQQSSPGT